MSNETKDVITPKDFKEFHIFSLWGSIILMAATDKQGYYASGKTKDEAATKLATVIGCNKLVLA